MYTLLSSKFLPSSKFISIGSKSMVSFHSFFSPPETKIEHKPDNLSPKKRKWPQEEVDVALHLRPPASTIYSDDRQECNNPARKKFTRVHPRQPMIPPPKSLDLRLNLSSQSNLSNHWSTVTSPVPMKEVDKEEKEMVTAACSRCNMLVMLCKSSPSCPNCKFLHHPLESTFRHYV